jgi:hypothetical protein
MQLLFWANYCSCYFEQITADVILSKLLQKLFWANYCSCYFEQITAVVILSKLLQMLFWANYCSCYFEQITADAILSKLLQMLFWANYCSDVIFLISKYIKFHNFLYYIKKNNSTVNRNNWTVKWPTLYLDQCFVYITIHKSFLYNCNIVVIVLSHFNITLLIMEMKLFIIYM